MPEPRASFSFLFTDVEGSSRLWEENAEAMALALARHDTLLNDLFSGHGGHVFKMMGDSVCVAYAAPAKAVDAAIHAQRALLAEEWETARPLRVRMAIHHGPAEERNADYFGPALNRTARVLAAGHGGQVLLSRAAQEHAALPPGASLRDLGERRLRDLDPAGAPFPARRPRACRRNSRRCIRWKCCPTICPRRSPVSSGGSAISRKSSGS